MRIEIKNEDRTVDECDEIFQWVIETFGQPSQNLKSAGRWTYGKTPDANIYGSHIAGTWEIQYYEFVSDEDASLFALRWM